MSAEKKCPDCGRSFPNTAEFFNPEYGDASTYLSRRCRPCESRRLWQSNRGGIWSSLKAKDRLDPYTGDTWGED